MRFSSFVMILLVLLSSGAIAQDDDVYKINTIPLQLKIKSNAVIRFNDVVVEVNAYNRFTLKNKRIVTVFNEQGISDQGTVVSYNKNRIIKTLEARIYDENGEQIKKFKKMILTMLVL